MLLKVIQSHWLFTLFVTCDLGLRGAATPKTKP